jgi:hypothetical protein
MVSSLTPEWATYVGYMYYFDDGSHGLCLSAQKMEYGVRLTIKDDHGTTLVRNSRNISLAARR